MAKKGIDRFPWSHAAGFKVVSRPDGTFLVSPDYTGVILPGLHSRLELAEWMEMRLNHRRPTRQSTAGSKE